MDKELMPIEVIENRIYLIRGQKVMLDRDLATLYSVETKQLKRAVKRNMDRFPNDFMFALNKEEMKDLGCQIGTPVQHLFGGYHAFAFTEQGVAMLSDEEVRSKKYEVKTNTSAFTLLTSCFAQYIPGYVRWWRIFTGRCRESIRYVEKTQPRFSLFS